LSPLLGWLEYEMSPMTTCRATMARIAEENVSLLSPITLMGKEQGKWRAFDLFFIGIPGSAGGY